MKKFNDLLPEVIIRILSLCAVFVIVFIFYFVFSKAMPVLIASGIGLITSSGFDNQLKVAFSSPNDPLFTFGMLALIVGTLLSTGISLALATILSVGSAIVICELAPKKLSTILTAFVRLLASIPSVIFGLVGIMTVVPFIKRFFVNDAMVIKFLGFFQITGTSLLASIIVLSFMIVPTVCSLCINAINSVPTDQKEVGFSFGMSHFRVIWKIMLPAARSGIIAGVILGAGRGIEEAIALSMVCGAVGFIPNITHGPAALLTPILPLSAAIINKSEAMGVASVESALFACGAILLLMGAVLSISAKFTEKIMRRSAGHDD